MLTASILHDYRHPGVNNGFLMKTSHAIALRYNDESVLENFHVAEGFAVMATAKCVLRARGGSSVLQPPAHHPP